MVSREGVWRLTIRGTLPTVRRMPRIFLTLVCAIVVASLPPAVHAQSKPYEATEKKHSWLSFNRPAEKTAAAQLARARRFHEMGRLRKATRAYKALIAMWPASPEARDAQLGLAEALDERGKRQDAFEAYHVLLSKYSAGFDYDAVVARMFEIAREEMERKRGGFLFFGGFTAPERAIPLFEKILRNAPRSPFAAEAQYRIGRAYELSEQLEEAVTAYLTTLNRYFDSPWAEDAAFRRVLVLERISREAPNDYLALEEAWTAAVFFRRNFPNSKHGQEISELMEKLRRRRERAAFERARFYERVVRRPAAAVRAYEEFIRQFPNSEWTPEARARMEMLSPLVEKADETN